MQTETTSPKGFVQDRLPWVIAGGALLVYLLTLSWGVTYTGLPALTKAAGWDWTPTVIGPLNYLVTYPVRWLPAGWQPAGVNVLSAFLAALTLGLLARCVALLPHDRTRDQRAIERNDYSLLSIKLAWVPPVFAAIVCGAQMTFWENAIIGTGEMIDLLVFAYVVRCLLEYRLDEREPWLLRLAFVYGVGLTNNYALAGFLPLLLVTLVWTMGFGFFRARFLTRFFLLLLAGLLLYLLLPAIGSLSDLTDQSFWDFLRSGVIYQKGALMSIRRVILLLAGLTSVLPVLFMGIRWPASFGDISAAGNALTNLMTHVIHAVFLLACLYVAFDPPVGARALTYGRQAFLPAYFLGALSIGYCLGYFLLVLGAGPSKAWQRPTALKIWTFRVLYWLTCLLAAAVPVALLVKNIPQIRADGGPILSRFATMAAQALPAKGAVVLSDDPFRLYALHNQLAAAGTRQNHILADTSALAQPAYHRYLRKTYGARWPGQLDQRPINSGIDSVTLIRLISTLALSNDVFYLHPSFGYYFERFYLKPHGLVYQMQTLPTNSVSAPTLTAAEIQENDAFWKKFKAENLEPTIRILKKRNPKEMPPPPVVYASTVFSRALNYFGVEAQKAGDLQKGREYFGHALEVNPDNPSAFLNLDYNKILLAGKRESPEPSEGVKKRLGAYGGAWNNIIGFNGPVDEPNTCFLLADTLARGQNYRQAAQTLERVIQFNPDNFGAQLGLAMMLNQAGMPDRSLAQLARIRAQGNLFTLDLPKEIALSQAEAWAWVGKNDVNAAQKILENLQERQPRVAEPFSTLAEIYLVLGNSTNAMAVLEKQLKVQGTNVSALINYAVLKIGGREVEAAIPLLDRALALEPQNIIALLNRAIANLYTERLEPARRDYEALERLLPRPSHLVYYGLGDIAWRQKRRKDAIKYYELYLVQAPLGAPEIRMINDRLEKLKEGSF